MSRTRIRDRPCRESRYAAVVDVDGFRQRIVERIAELEDLADSSRASAAVVELDQTRQGRLSRMDALQGQAMAKAADQRRVQQIQRLKAALARIERGGFGQCLACGGAIAGARLQADPAVALCVECASARE